MTEVKKGHYVKVHYTGSLDDGSTFDSSKGRDPLEVLAGEGMLIKGFDDALLTMKAGEEKKITINAEEAYGPRREDMVRPVPRKEFGDMELTEGMTIGIRAPTGQVFPVTVVEIKDDDVVIDGNHPLAGKTLHFDIKVEEAREPTEEDMKKFQPHHHDHEGCGCGGDCGCDHDSEDGCGCDDGSCECKHDHDHEKEE
ncbi:MAG: peptidylprolyl isomerase [Simkania sp.]|nr:peptidylprolyl isomerase [Nanoarchaeota archaeon]MCB1084403.1 peptidylprolyl isomerase [Simkania sp.]